MVEDGLVVIYSAECRVQIGWISLDSFRAGLDIDAKAVRVDRQQGHDRIGQD